MKIVEKFKPLIYDKDLYLKDEILNTEFSKSGLSQFYSNNGRYLSVVLMDGLSYTAFDKNGTYPLNDEGDGIDYEPTGSFKNKPEGRRSNKKLWIFASVENVFDFINYFENEKDCKDLPVITEEDD